MPISLTEEQRQQMIEKGFCVIPEFFQGAELQAIVEGMESCRGGRGAHAVSETTVTRGGAVLGWALLGLYVSG